MSWRIGSVSTIQLICTPLRFKRICEAAVATRSGPYAVSTGGRGLESLKSPLKYSWNPMCYSLQLRDSGVTLGTKWLPWGRRKKAEACSRQYTSPLMTRRTSMSPFPTDKREALGLLCPIKEGCVGGWGNSTANVWVWSWDKSIQLQKR